MTASKQSGWNSSSILTLLGNGQQKPKRNLPVPNVQQKIPDDGQRSYLAALLRTGWPRSYRARPYRGTLQTSMGVNVVSQVEER